MRLIDLDKVRIGITAPRGAHKIVQEVINKLNEKFDELPTVDAEPVRHGRWIFNPKDAIEMMFTLPKCSECGAESPNGGNYCPNCGAKMGGVKSED